MKTIRTVKLKAKPCEYMVYDGTNYEEIREFADPAQNVPPSDCKPKDRKDFLLYCGYRMEWVQPGDYVVKDANGIMSVYTKEMFNQKFEPWNVMDDINRMLPYAHRHCWEDECFVMQGSEDIPCKKKRSEVADSDEVVKCIICHEPATQLDSLFPSDTMDNRCSKHAKSQIDPCAWSDYGVAVEVCTEHYDFLITKVKIEGDIDFLDNEDKSVTGKALRDKLVATLKELDYYMKATWPHEQMAHDDISKYADEVLTRRSGANPMTDTGWVAK